MALSIKDPEVDRKARLLASQHNSSITAALNLALDGALSGQERFSPEERARRMASISDMQDRIAAQAINWTLSDDDLLGYDENGLPN